MIWEQAELRISAQLQQADALDTKAGVLLGVHALAAGLLAALASDIEGPATWVAMAVLVGLVVTVFLALQAFRAQDYDRSPAPETLARFASWRPEEIRLRFLSTRLEAIAGNRSKLRRKARYLSWSLSGLTVIALVVAVATAWSLIL